MRILDTNTVQDEPRHRARHDAGIEKDSLRRPASPPRRTNTIRGIELVHRRHLLLLLPEDSKEQRLVCCCGLVDRYSQDASDMTTMKYVEPAAMGSGEEPKLVTTTIQEYDQTQIMAGLKGQAMGCAMMGFMHLYLKYTNPLLIQSIIPLKGAFESNIVKVYIFGKPAVGELKRPWKQAGKSLRRTTSSQTFEIDFDIGGMMGIGQSEVKSDKASIEAAERSGRGGAKEE